MAMAAHDEPVLGYALAAESSNTIDLWFKDQGVFT
jgi:hypothetical protein